MLILGIETSGIEGSIALTLDGENLGERLMNQVGRRHAQSLVLEISELLQANGFTPQNVQCVAVSRGPGSFTGLRVGMTCAKTFAYATGCEFIAVDTFAAIAAQASEDVAELYVIDDAQRADLFVGRYIRTHDLYWDAQSPVQILPVDEFLRTRDDSIPVTGPGLRKLDLSECHLTSQSIRRLPGGQPHASQIARLGLRDRTATAGTRINVESDFWRATPFYLRLSAAEEKRISQNL